MKYKNFSYKRKKFRPELISEISNGYILTKYNQLFRGEGDELPYDRDAYYILRNPATSDANVFIQTIFLSNNSMVPMTAKCICNSDVSGDLTQSQNIVSANTYDTLPHNKAYIVSGTDVTLTYGISSSTYNLPAYGSMQASIQGCILLAPGSNFVVMCQPLANPLHSTSVIGFEWWEEAL